MIAGKGFAEIASTLGTTRQTVSRWGRQMGYTRRNRKRFAYEIELLRAVLDEMATVQTMFVENAPADKMADMAQIIADILQDYPNRITCEKCYQNAAGLALHLVRLLRILAETASKATDKHKLFDCFTFIRQITIKALSILSE